MLLIPLYYCRLLVSYCQVEPLVVTGNDTPVPPEFIVDEEGRRFGVAVAVLEVVVVVVVVVVAKNWS